MENQIFVDSHPTRPSGLITTIDMLACARLNLSHASGGNCKALKLIRTHVFKKSSNFKRVY
jgi:hypothetical protein